jgi:hypothetical protein
MDDGAGPTLPLFPSDGSGRVETARECKCVRQRSARKGREREGKGRGPYSGYSKSLGRQKSPNMSNALLSVVCYSSLLPFLSSSLLPVVLVVQLPPHAAQSMPGRSQASKQEGRIREVRWEGAGGSGGSGGPGGPGGCAALLLLG